MTDPPAGRPRIAVVGIGSRLRGDDGAAIAVLEALRGRVSGVELIEHPGEGLDLLPTWKGMDAVFLVDAVVSGTAPGTLHRIDLTREGSASAARGRTPLAARGFSSHRLGLAQVVELARVLDSLPDRLVLLGVEGSSFQAGTGLSPAVALAVPRLAARLRIELRRAAGGAPRPDPAPAPGR